MIEKILRCGKCHGMDIRVIGNFWECKVCHNAEFLDRPGKYPFYKEVRSVKDSEMTRPLAEEGSKILLAYLKGEKQGGDKVRIALASLQTHVKMKATEANDDTNKLGLVKLIYTDQKARQEYIKKTMPHMLTEEK